MAGEITRKASLIFDADTSRAQAQIQSLASSLNTVFDKSSQRSGISQLDQDLQQATLNAATLQATLNQAVNVNTGKLDLTKFNASLKSANLSLSTLQSSLGAAGAAGNTAFVQLARSIATAEAPLKRTNGLIQSLAVSLGNTIKWNISSSIMNGFISSVQTAFNYAEKLNESLTNIQIVTGESNSQMAKFAEQANKSAQALSTTTRKYTDAALIFYQQGLGDADVKARTDAVIKMANVTGDASKEVSNYMTAIWNNFDNGTSSLESFEDKIVSLGATTASSSAEIASGLEKFAAVGNTVGLSFDYAAAALATVVAETRQSADTVGTAFRTLFSRLQGLKLGETLDDGTTLNKYSSALAAVGVQIKTTSGELKSMDTILTEMHDSWEGLSQAQKVALAQTVGGARQYATVISLMENWDKFQKNLQTEMNSEGTLNKQAEIYAQSWEAAKNRVTASMEALYSSLIDDKFFINLNNGLSNVLTGVNSFIQNLGGVKGALMNIGTIALNVFDKQMTQSLDNLIHNVKLTFGMTEKEMKALQTEATSLLTTTVGTTGTAGGSAMATAYAQEAAAQMKLIEQSEQLSSGEKLVADILTQRIQKRVDEQTVIADATDKAEAALDREQASLNQLITATSGDSGVQQAFSNMGISAEDFATQLRSAYSDLQSFENIGADMGNIFTNLDSGKDIFLDGMADLQNYVNNIDITGFSEQGQAAFQQLADAINDPTSSLDELQAAYENFSQTTDGSIKNVQDNMDKLNDEIQRVWEKMEKNPGDASLKVTYNNLMDLYEGYHNVREKAETYGMSLAELQEHQRRTGQAVSDLNTYLEEHQIRIYSAAEQITLYARAITTLATFIRNVTNLTKVWSDDTKSLSEKLLTTVTTLGFMVPQMVRVSTQFMAMVKNIAAAKLVRETEIAAEAAKASFAGFAGGIRAIGTAITSTMPYLLLIAAAITTVVLAVKAFQQVTDNSHKSVSNVTSQYNQLKEGSKQLTSELQNVKDMANSVQEQFDKYNSIQEQLSNCTQGTQEWNDKLQEVLQTTSDIIAANPEMIEFMKNAAKYGFDTKSYRNDDGSINLNNLLPDYLRFLQGREGALTLAKTGTEQMAAVNETRATLLPELSDIVASGTNYSLPDLDWGSKIFGSSSNHTFKGKINTQGQIQFGNRWFEQSAVNDILHQFDTAFGDTTFSDALERVAGTHGSIGKIIPISRGQMAQGIAMAASSWGLQNGAGTFDEAVAGWQKNGVDSNLLNVLLTTAFGPNTTVDSILSSVENIGLDNGTQIHEQLNAAYIQAYTDGVMSNSASAITNFGTNLPDELKEELSPEILNSLNGRMGDLVVSAMIGAIGTNGVSPSMLSDYAVANGHPNMVLEHEGDGKYVGRENGEVVSGFENVDIHTIIGSSDEFLRSYMQQLNSGKLAEIINSTIDSLGDLKGIISNGNFNGYTMQEARNATEHAQNDAYLNSMVTSAFNNSNYAEEIFEPQLARGRELFVKYFDDFSSIFLAEKTIDLGQLFDLEDMSVDLGDKLRQQIVQAMPLLSTESINSILNFDFSGNDSIIEFYNLLSGLGLVIDQNSEAWQTFVSNVQKGKPALDANAQAFGNISDASLESLSTLAQGKTISSEAREKLSAAGFNTEGLISYQGKYKLGEGNDPLGIEKILQDASGLKSLISTDDQGQYEVNWGAANTELGDRLAHELGFENAQEMISSQLFDGLLDQDVLGKYANYDFNGLYQIAAQFGTMWRGTLEKIDKGLADQYAPIMAQRQAEIEGLTLSSVELKSIKDLNSMDMVLNGRRTVTQASTLASLYGKQDWAATDFMTAQQYEGLNITEDMDYSQRQAAIAAYMETLSAAGPYAAELKSYLEAIADTEFSEATASLTQLINQLQITQDLLDNFNLDDLASNSGEAWEALTKKIGLTRTEFSKLSKEQQRSKLGEAQRSNLADILTQQQALAQAYEKHYQFNGQTTDQAILDSYVNDGTMSAYTQYLQVLQQIATTRQNMATSQNNEKNDIIAIHVTELDARIAALQAAHEAEQAIIDKYSTASSDLVNAITDGALSAVQRLQIAGVEGGAEILAAWDAAGTSGERAMAAAQMTAQYTEAALQQQAKIQAGISGAQDWFGGRSAGDKLLSMSAWSSSDEMKALWQNDKTLSDQAINELITADKKVRDSLGAKATTADYATAMKAELATMSSDAQAAWDQIAASGKDTLSGIFVNLGEEARTAAQTATEAWLSAFEAIANARATLMQGGNLLETLAGNPETLLQLARGTATDGDIAGQMQRIVQGTTSGTLKASDLNSNLSWQDYKNNQLAQYNLNATADGWAAQFAQGNATVTGDRYRLANQLGLNVNNPKELLQLNEALIDSYSKILQANGMEAQAAKTLARKAVETGEGYDEVKKASGNLSSAIDYSTGLYALQQKSAEDTTAIQAAGDVTKTSYGGRTQEQWAKLQDAISKGQTAAKTSSDQSSWEQQMLASGYGDALQLLNEAGIGFGNVNTAAESCAAALAALASAAEAAAKKEAQERGYTQNAQGKWQKDYSGGVTQSQLAQEYGEEGWQSVANSLTAVTDDKGNIIKYTGVYVDEGLTSALQTIITQSQEAQASLEQIQLQKLSDAASALGTDLDGLESYVESIALAEGTLQSMKDSWGEWNDMSVETQTMLAEAAVEYNKSITALKELGDVAEKIKAIKDVDITDPNKLQAASQAYRDLADTVNSYFLDGLADSEFVANNLSLIEDWANGVEGAMEKVEAALLEVFNKKYELDIPQDGDYGLGELNNWANGIQYGEALTQEQLDWINNFQRVNGLSDEMLAKMADLCGVTLEFNHETVKIPKNTAETVENLGEMVKKAKSMSRETKNENDEYKDFVEQIAESNTALSDVKKNIKACGEAGSKSYKDVANQGAKLASIAAATEDAFIGYNGILDGAEAKTAAWNDALQAVADSGASTFEVISKANESLEAAGLEPINIPVEVDTSQADADLAQVTDLEGLIHYLEEHEEVDPAVLEQEGVIKYSYTGDAPSYHTEEETAADSTTFSGGGDVTVGPFMGFSASIPYHFSYTADGDTTAAVPVLDGASGGGGNRGGGGGAKPRKSGGGGGCFEAGTLITTINGYKNIEDIQVGDIVLSYNEKSQQNEYSQVLETMIHVIVDNIYTLHIKDDSLVVTGIHRFYVKRMGRTMWIAAANLHVNDIVLFADGTWHLIEAIDIEYKAAVVYNFEVSGNHNYYVGKNRILAHNKGGGGGRREDQKGDRKRKEQRYVTNTNQLEDLQDNLDKINKAEERSYGRNRIKQMQDKVKALDALAKKQHDLYEEAKAYQEQDKNDLLNNDLAKKAGIKWEFDENGTILNRDEIEQRMVDYYNSFTKDKDKNGEYILKNNTEAGAVEFKNMQEAYAELEELLDKYDESQDKVKEYWQEYLDSINEMYDTVVEMATYKVEVQVEVSDEALKIIDFMLMQIEDDAYKAAEAIAKMGLQAQEYIKQNDINNTGIRELFNHHNGVSQYADDNGKLHTTTDLRGIVDGLMNNEDAAWAELMKHEQEFTADEIDAIQDMVDANLEAAESMAELQKDMYDKISETFDSLSEDMDRYIAQIDHLRQVTENYTNIVDIVGKKHLGITNELMAETNLAAVDQDINRVIATRSKYLHQQEMLVKLQDKFKNINGNTMTASQRDILQQMSQDESLDMATRQRYSAMAANPNAQLTDRDVQFLKEQMQHVQDEVDASNEDFIQSWEDALSSIADWYTKKMEGVIEDVSNKLAGEMGSLQELADQFEKSNEMQSQYVEDYERIYELSKLNRDIVNSIDETQNVKAKQALAELQAEINQMDEDNVELTRYQIENARRRYELTLAQLALEETKNAKSQVSMSRSATGEWSYVYTADESQVEEAEQNYEDKLFAMQQANAEYINELQQNIVDLQERMIEEIEALRVEDFASAEEYYAKVQEIKDYYGNLMDINLDNLDIVFAEQERLYTDDWATYSEMTGYKISEDENYIDKWNETALSKLTGFETMQEFHENFNDASEQLLEESNEAYEIWEQKTEEAMEAAGTSIEGYREVMDTEVAEIVNDSDEAASSIEDLGEMAVDTFDQMTEAVSNWQAEYSAMVDDMLQKNEALALSFNKLLKEWSGYNDTVGQDDSTGTDSSDNEGEQQNPGGPPANEGGNESESAMEKTEKYKKAIAFAIWTHSSSGWGHGNSSKKLTSGDRYNRLKEKGLVPDVVQQQINKYRGKSVEYMQNDTGIKFKWHDKDKALKPYTYKGFSFDTGGYTGDWVGSDGRIAMLHSKEIVLNKDDTENFLSGIEILRDITKAIDLNALASAGYMSNMVKVGNIGGMGTLEQDVYITAEFPNATDKDSIKEAFNDLINLASQYANRK